MPEPGRIEDGAHRWPLRVYYEDTDASGIVYYANHLKYAERARTETLRALGLDHSTLLGRFGLVFVVRRCTADYRAPARLDDALEVTTRLLRFGGATMDLCQEVSRDGCLLVRLEVRLALVSSALRPARLPQELRDLLAQLRETDAEDRL